MMANLEQVGVQVYAFAQEAPLGFSAGISREKHAKTLVLQDERDRVVVDIVLRMRDKRQRGPDERQRYAVVRLPDVAGERVNDGHLLRLRRLQRVLIREAAVALAAVGKFRNVKCPHYGGETADMIAVRILLTLGDAWLGSVVPFFALLRS